MEQYYKIDGLDCANCAMKLEKNIRKLEGIHTCEIDFIQKSMMVDMEDENIFEKVKKVVHEMEPDVILEKKHSHHHHEHHEHHHDHESCCGHEHHHGECGCGHHHEEHTNRILDGALKLYVKNLDCANCANKVERHVQAMENVADASMNFSNGILFVKLKNQNKREETIQAIQKEVPKIEDGVVVELESKEEKESLFSIRKNARLYLGIILFVIALLTESYSWSFWVFLAAYIVAGGHVVYVALKNIIKGEVFDENFLMSVATIGAFAIASYEEAVAVMIFYEIGEMFQSYAVQRSRKSIASLMNIRADYANLLKDGKEIKVSPEDVKVHDYIIVKPGERVPLDGKVVEGNSSLDTSALTGETLPRDVEKNDEVLAGVVNISGLLTIEVEKEYGESTVSRILELVEHASSKKAKMEKFITRFARVYTPTVVLLAVALAVLPMLFVEDAVFSDWLYRALTFLVVSCPCALVISVPLGMFAGIGAASKAGILIKGGNYLEILKDVDTVVFDKTGTLTKGIFTVTDVESKMLEPNELVELAAYAEAYSSHPIAVSIRKAYGKEIDTTKLHDYKEVAGNGIQVEVFDKQLLVGNNKLMKEHNISFEETDVLGTIVHVAADGVYQGYLVIDDEIKETSKEAIQSLKQAGVTKCVMLSGDHQRVGDYVGKKLGLDEVYMELLPADKVEKVETLLANETGKLAFVGDGINDAPVLARADIGVAMGGIGSDAAIEAADVVLMKDDPMALTTAIRIAKKTMGILWQNIIFSLGIKVLILILTAFGFANMWLGVFADVGVTLIAILNSMRALNIR